MAAHLLFSKRHEVDGSKHVDLIRHGSAQSLGGKKLCRTSRTQPENLDKLDN
jgi:hypothetical protein